MRYSSEVKVGIVFLIGLFVMIFGYFWLRGVGLGADLYYLKLDGAAQIAQGNDVRLQGVKIGQVQDIGFDPETQKPFLTLEVRKGNPPFRLLHSYAYSVQSAGVLGENYVDIRGAYNPKDVSYQPNDKSSIILGKAHGGLLSVADSAQDVVKDFRGTLANLNVTLDRINRGVLNYQNQVKLTKTLDGIARLTNNAAQGFGPNGVRIGFGNPQAQRDLNSTLANAALASQSAAMAAHNIQVSSQKFGGLTGQAQGLLGDLRGTVDANRGQIGTLTANLSKVANNIAGVTETLDFTLKQGNFKENSQLAFQSLRRAAENVEVATGGIRKLATDEATQTDLKTTLTALRESTEALRDTAQTIRNTISDDKTKGQIGSALTSLGETAKNLDDVTAGLKNIVGDPDLQSNVKGAAANLNSTLAATRAAAERINGLLGGKKAKKDAGAPGSGKERGARKTAAPADFPTGVDFTYRHYSEVPTRGGGSDVSGRNYGDLNFNGEFFGGPFRLGLDNIGSGDNLTLQSGQFFGSNIAARYGIYRSKLGAGLELRKGRFSLEGNIWNPNNRSYNFYGGVKLTKNLEIIAGREGLRGDRTNAIGVRLSH